MFTMSVQKQPEANMIIAAKGDVEIMIAGSPSFNGTFNLITNRKPNTTDETQPDNIFAACTFNSFNCLTKKIINFSITNSASNKIMLKINNTYEDVHTEHWEVESIKSNLVLQAYDMQYLQVKAKDYYDVQTTCKKLLMQFAQSGNNYLKSYADFQNDGDFEKLAKAADVFFQSIINTLKLQNDEMRHLININSNSSSFDMKYT